jgi:hypothetical protein
MTKAEKIQDQQERNDAIALFLLSNTITTVPTRLTKQERRYAPSRKDLGANLNAVATRELRNSKYYKLVLPLNTESRKSSYFVATKSKSDADITLYDRQIQNTPVLNFTWTKKLNLKMNDFMTQKTTVKSREKYLIVKHSNPALFNLDQKSKVSNVFEIRWDTQLKTTSKEVMLVSFDPREK